MARPSAQRGDQPCERAGIFGAVTWQHGMSTSTITGGRRRLLLGLLLLVAPDVVPLARICEALWPGRPPAQAKGATHVQVHRLRHVLGDAAGARLLTRPNGYSLDTDGLDVDVVAFRRDLTLASELRRAGQVPACAAALRQALSRWTGDPLGDCDPRVRSWPEIEALVESRRHALHMLFDFEITNGHVADVLVHIRAAVREFPHHELFREHLMRALCRWGRYGEAAQTYREYRSWKVESLGLEPGPRLRELHTAVLRQEPELLLRQEAVAPGPARVHDIRATLLRAADFTEAMGGYTQAVQCLGDLVALTPPTTSDRPRLLLRLAACRLKSTGAGMSEAREAARLFSAAGDRLGVVEAQLLEARIAWCAGQGTRAVGILHEARGRLGALPAPQRSVAAVASAIGMLAVTGEHATAGALARSALSARQQPLTAWERARFLSGVGLARLADGDPGALADLRAAVSVHQRANGWVDVQFLVNLMDAEAIDGDLPAYVGLLDRARQVCRANGSDMDTRYLDACRAWQSFWSGDLHRARREVDTWLARQDSHFLLDRCRFLDIRLKLVEGDLRGAGDGTERMLGGEEGTRLPQARVMALVAAAVLALLRDRSPGRARGFVEDAISEVGAGFLPPEIGSLLAVAMRAAEVPADALATVADSRWLRATRQHLASVGWHGAFRRVASRPDIDLAGDRSGRLGAGTR